MRKQGSVKANGAAGNKAASGLKTLEAAAKADAVIGENRRLRGGLGCAKYSKRCNNAAVLKPDVGEAP